MRDAFHVPTRYFLSHSVGCQPKRASAALDQAYLNAWAEQGGAAWPAWLDVIDQNRVHLSSLFGGQAEHYCPQINISSALTKILYALPDRPNAKTIVCTQADFPTTGFVFRQAERMGFSCRFVDGDVTDPEAWARCMDDTVAIVFITHAFSNTSELAPVGALCQMARDHGAVSIVDIAQSAGVVPIDLPLWQADFAVGTGVKFLCCGPGACFLYAAPDMLAQAEPIDVGWFSHADPFEMDIHSFRYAPCALRFLGGTPSPAPLTLANAALEQWQSLGLAAVHARVQQHLSQLAAHVPDPYLVSPRAPNARGATLVVAPSNRTQFAALLESEGFRFDERREGFRLSVHAYTSDDEIAALADILQDALRR